MKCDDDIEIFIFVGPCEPYSVNTISQFFLNNFRNYVLVNRMVDTFYGSRWIAKSIGYGLDLTIQVEQKVIVSVYYHPDYYTNPTNPCF